MSQKYDNVHKIVTFEVNEIVTLAIPRDDRAATDSTRIVCKVLAVPHFNRHQLQSRYGVLDKFYPTRVLNQVPEESWSDLNTEIFAEASKEEITLHHAAQLDARSKHVAVSCSCTKQCKTKKCLCKKNNLICTQYCHSEERDCGNMGTILEGTEASIVPRTDLVQTKKPVIQSKQGLNRRPTTPTPMPTRSTSKAPKRTRAEAISATASPAKPAAKKGRKDAASADQMTLSQYPDLAPVVRRLEQMEVKKD